MDDAATHTTNVLQFVATAAAQDTAAGSSVVITTVRTVAGVPPANPDTLTLSLYNDAGALIDSRALDTTAASQTNTFFFTATGASGGANRAGTVEIAIRATRTSVGTYDIETDATPNTAPATFDSHLDRGWIRGTTTATTVLSNVALGGAKSIPAQYDESLFARTTLGAALYVARALTVAISLSTPALSGATNSATSGNFDASFANVADNRFPAASTVANTSLTVPNATLTAQPATVLTATNDSITVDPRLTASHHFQVDDNTFATAKNDTSKAMLATQSGFLATRLVTARTAAGVNALTLSQTLTPVGPGTAVGPTSSATATRDTQAGWSDLLAWTSSKPGGAWNKTISVTAPADIVGATYVVAGTDALTLLAPDPRLRVVVGAGPYGAAADSDHWTPGIALLVGLAVVNSETRMVLTPDATPTPGILVGRFNQTFGRAEYLDSDLTWKATSGATIHRWPLAASAGDAQTWVAVFANTTGFSTADLFFIGCASVGGTPYSGPAAIGVAGAFNPHSTGGDAVTPADITAIANAVWDELTAEARASGSYGQLVKDRIDVAVSTRATPGQITVRDTAQTDIA